MHKASIALAAALLSSQLHAATVFKCVDAAGKVTFTQNQNCPRSSALDDVVSAHNATPSGSSAPVQMADPDKPRAQPVRGSSVVIGMPSAPAPVPEPEIKQEAPRTVVVRPANQPCIKLVDRMVSCSTKNRGCVQVIKVPVACRP